MDSLVGKRGEEKKGDSIVKVYAGVEKGVLYHHTDYQPKQNGNMLLWHLWGTVNITITEEKRNILGLENILDQVIEEQKETN